MPHGCAHNMLDCRSAHRYALRNRLSRGRNRNGASLISASGWTPDQLVSGPHPAYLSARHGFSRATKERLRCNVYLLWQWRACLPCWFPRRRRPRRLNFTAALSGGNEVPGVVTGSAGTATVSLNQATGVVTYRVDVYNMPVGTTAVALPCRRSWRRRPGGGELRRGQAASPTTSRSAARPRPPTSCRARHRASTRGKTSCRR